MVGGMWRSKFFRRIVAACLLLLAIGSAVAMAQMSFHGNVKTHIFHRPGCRYFNCGACTAIFDNREAAIRSGYRPCKVCNP